MGEGRFNPLDPDTDCFKPPAVPTLVHCLHCGEEYDSYLIHWVVETCADGKPFGFWCCPVDGCDGKGFGFDIFPVDPDYVGEDGEKMWCDDGEDDDEDDDEDWEDAEGWTPQIEVDLGGDQSPTGETKRDDPMSDDDIPW